MGLPAARRASAAPAGLPWAATRPPSSTTHRSERGRAASSRCSLRSTAVPSSRFTRTRQSRNRPAETGSSWAVGSSSSSTLGSMAMTEARFSSCFCPPDRVSVSRWNQLSMPKKAAISATRPRISSPDRPRLSRPKASSCHTLSVTICSSGRWSTKPTAVWARGESSPAGRPSSSTAPDSVPWGERAGFSSRSRVVLPLPDGPQRVTNSPAFRARSTPSRAGRTWPG